MQMHHRDTETQRVRIKSSSLLCVSACGERSRTVSPWHIVSFCALCVFAAKVVSADPTTKTESFDQDPRWESQNNRPPADIVFPTISQDFGYTKTHFTSKTDGEIGGRLWRSTTPAWYAKKLEKPLTLDDRFSASGTFCFTESSANS